MSKLIRKRWVKIYAFLSFLVISLCLGMLLPSWPSKARLCRDLESHIPVTECMALDHRAAIVEQAFPIGTTSTETVKSAIGDYLHDEYQTDYGHRETYYLDVSPIAHVFRYYSKYNFRYDKNGTLVAFSYED